MKKNLFYLLCAAMSGLIVILGSIVAAKFGIAVSLSAAAVSALIAAAAVFILLIPALREKIRHICCDLDWADETARAYNAIPALYRQSFWIIFGFVNLAFLFHTINFMWGNRDWAAVRFAVDPAESLKEGRFSAYWLQELLFDGKILPVANNLWAFAGLSLAAVLLGIYWNLPQKRAAYVITGLFFAVTPYTLSWLYFAKNTLGNLWLPAIVLAALLLSEKKPQSLNRAYAMNLAAILLFIIAFGTYIPVVNFIGVAVLGKIFLKTVFSDIPLKTACKRMVQTAANLTAALLIYAFIIVLLKDAGIMTPAYNTELAPLTALPFRLPELFSAMVAQFAVPMPFIDGLYKLLYLAVALIALFALIIKSPNAKAAARGLLVIPFILIASKLAFFLSVPSAENPAYLARIDFYGLPLIYALMLATILKLGGEYLKRIGYALAVIIIFMGFVRVAYAQKVWKFGWEAETKLAERIITRLEKMPEFDINRQYKLLQIGEKSLRPRYYLKKSGEFPSGELLGWAYYPAGHAKDAYNFYYQTDFLSADAGLSAAKGHQELRDYLLNRARAWPAKESLFISGEYIVFVLDEAALVKAQGEIAR